MPSESQSIPIRSELVEALRLDLVGPSKDHAFANELLPEAPSRWYLTGYLVPKDAPDDQRIDDTADEEIEGAEDTTAADDGTPPDRATARRSLLPSSMGLSVLVLNEAKELHVTVCWGDYIYEGVEPTTEETNSGTTSESSGTSSTSGRTRGYRRIPRKESLTVGVPDPGENLKEQPVPNSDGLFIAVTARDVGYYPRLPQGTRSVSVFLVNRRAPDKDRHYKRFVFQTELRVTSKQPFVARPDLRRADGDKAEWDDQVADLHYRDVFEYAVGHGVATRAIWNKDRSCNEVHTTWLPTAEVERIAPTNISGVERRMEMLAELVDGTEAKAKLSPIVSAYRTWIKVESDSIKDLEQTQEQTAKDLLINAQVAAQRIEAGIDALKDPDVLYAFKLANRCMAQAARRREAILRQTTPDKVDTPQWYPFQLAFVLMTLRSIIDPTCDDRERVDLLFFPTGGGKTEAYLGLAAFTMICAGCAILESPRPVSASSCGIPSDC